MNLTDNVIKIILRYYIFLYNHISYFSLQEKFFLKHLSHNHIQMAKQLFLFCL